MEQWTDPRWRAEAQAWIQRQLEQVGLEQQGEVDQPHVRPWSTVLRVPTNAGPVWFKANMPAQAYEAGIVRVISSRRPDLVPALLGTDVDRGWMLMVDGGERLREVVERERDLGRWLDLLPRYGELQLDLIGDADELVALGTPHVRLATIASDYGELVERLPSLTTDQRRRAERLTARVGELAEELAAFGIPETIQHDDLHDGQIFVRDGRYLFFDWGDACVSHPLFSMSVTLEGFLAWGLDDVEGSEDVTPYGDAYLSAFSRYGTVKDLRRALPVALRLGWVCRALNVERMGLALEPGDRVDHMSPALRLELFASELDRRS